MMSTQTFQEKAYEELTISSQRELPVGPYPRKHVHAAFDSLEGAVEAVRALRAAGWDARDIALMASWDFVEAIEAEPQQHGLGEALTRFFSFLDDSFDVYLREARWGRHILAVRVWGHEQIMQVRAALVPYRARHVKYIDTWTVADLSS